MTENALTVVTSAAPIARREVEPMTPADILRSMDAIQGLMSKVLKKGVHYDSLPGTETPMLLQPGIQKLSMMFRLKPNFTTQVEHGANGHREYTVECSLINQAGDFAGAGRGSCSTMESRYRYRKAPAEDTGVPVPKAYWEHWKTDAAKALEALGGKGFCAKKNSAGQWTIHKSGDGRVDNPDIADVYNTCLKMACKRAYSHAIQNATACSDVFEVDAEEIHSGAEPVLPHAEVEPKKKPLGKTTYSANKLAAFFAADAEGKRTTFSEMKKLNMVKEGDKITVDSPIPGLDSCVWVSTESPSSDIPFSDMPDWDADNK